jgi:hypothetical protein
LGLGTAGDDALVDTSKLFVLGTQTQGLMRKKSFT